MASATPAIALTLSPPIIWLPLTPGWSGLIPRTSGLDEMIGWPLKLAILPILRILAGITIFAAACTGTPRLPLRGVIGSIDPDITRREQ